jgi:hypothetical protein
VLVGLYWGWKKYHRPAIYMLLVMVCNIIYALNFSIPDIANYLLPTIAVLFIFGGWAVIQLMQERGYLRLAVLILVVVSLPFNLINNWHRQDQAGNYSAADGVENRLNSCAAPAVILSANWDVISPWLYLHFYEQRRLGVLMLSVNSLKRSWYFAFIRKTDRALFEYIAAEVEKFLPLVRRFEAGKPVVVSEIEQAYQAILRKIMIYPGRRVYFDQPLHLGFEPPGEIRRAGKLSRLVREGETFQPPAGPFPPPRFGKEQEYLSERERRHLDLFY